MRLFAFFLPALILGQNLTITPSSPAAAAGGSISITADRPVYFSLKGAGSITSTAGTKTTYTAPAALTQTHSLAGCMVLPSDSIFNTRIDNLPVSSNSAAWSPNMLSSYGTLLTTQWSTNMIDNTAQFKPQIFHFSTALNGVEFPVLPLSNRKRETGSYTTDPNNDHHMVTVNHQDCQFYETYQDGVAIEGCPTCTAGSGWTYSSSSYAQPGSPDNGGGTTDAAGLPLMPLTPHLDEIYAGAIKHALRYTACAGCISQGVLWPAVLSTGWAPGGIPMGTRFRLKSSFDISGYPPAAKVMLTALKQYGMFLADIGLWGQITLGGDITRDPNVVAEINTITGITYDNFDAVDESSLMLSPHSNQVNPANSYETPVNQAILTVTDAANSANKVQVPIALQTVTVGTPDPVLNVQVGTQPFRIPAWVNGTSSTGLTWSISPATGAGSIAQDGTYTAPAILGSTTTAMIKLASAADPSAYTMISLTLLPSGSLFIDSGSATQTVDQSGNVWLPDLGFETGSYLDQNDNWPSAGWGNIQEKAQYQTFKSSWGDDITYKFHVPNGNYVVALLFGLGGANGPIDTSQWDSGMIWGALNLETQGKTIFHNWNFGIPVNFQERKGVPVYLPATVTDTNLFIAIRALTSQAGHSAPIINGVAAFHTVQWGHLAIDNQQVTVVQPGGSLQLYPIDWFRGTKNVVWSIVSGPGTISPTGLYSAPALVLSQQSVQIKAYGADTGQSAYLTLTIP